MGFAKSWNRPSWPLAAIGYDQALARHPILILLLDDDDGMWTLVDLDSVDAVERVPVGAVTENGVVYALILSLEAARLAVDGVVPVPGCDLGPVDMVATG